MKNSFRLAPINELLNGRLQPWHKDCARNDEQYRDLLRNTAETVWPANLHYLLDYESRLLFTSRIRYYARLTDIAIAAHLRDAFALTDANGTEELALYIIKLTREATATLIHDAVSHCQFLQIGTESLRDFTDKREQKEYIVILHYIVASLTRCFMEIQQQYRQLIDDADAYPDVESFYASVAGWADAPIINVKVVDDSMDNGKKFIIPYCSFHYINDDKEDWNISMTAFFRKLVTYEQIPSDTDQKTIFSIFSGTRTNAVVTWTGKRPTLKTIIFRLFNEKKVLTAYPNTVTHWQVVSRRFRQPNGTMMPNLGSETDRKGDAPMIEDIISTLV